MINDSDDALDFQRKQRDAFTLIGAYLAPLKDFLDKAERDIEYADDISNLRRLVPHVENNDFTGRVNVFFKKYGYENYFGTLNRNIVRIKIAIVDQTLPPAKKETKLFVDLIETNFNSIVACQIALSQIPLPKVDFSIKAKTPLQAFCFFTHFFSTVTEHLYIVDPYIDTSIFYCYLYRLPKNVNIKIVSLSDKWNQRAKAEIEAVEPLFRAEYPSYLRDDKKDIHDRFIISETTALQLGGSLKDAAKKSPFSVVTLSDQRRSELIEEYFS